MSSAMGCPRRKIAVWRASNLGLSFGRCLLCGTYRVCGLPLGPRAIFFENVVLSSGTKCFRWKIAGRRACKLGRASGPAVKSPFWSDGDAAVLGRILAGSLLEAHFCHLAAPWPAVEFLFWDHWETAVFGKILAGSLSATHFFHLAAPSAGY